MNKSIYKFGIISLAIILILYVIAIIGRHSLGALTIISLVLIFPLIIIALTAFFIGYTSRGRMGVAVGLGIIFATFSYIITIAFAMPFGESQFVSRMKEYSSANGGFVGNLAGNLRTNIYWNVIWILVIGILFALIGFALKRKNRHN